MKLTFRMKYILLTEILLLLFINSNGQLSKWWMSVATTSNGMVDFSRITSDQWNNVYSIGTSGSGGVIFYTGDTLTCTGQSVFVFKQDAGGNLVWSKCFPAFNLGSYHGAIQTDASGFIYITGGGLNVALDTITINGFFIAKLHPADGHVVWAKSMAGSCCDLDFDSNGNIYPVFYSNSSAYFDTVWVVNNWGVGRGLGVGKMDNNGNAVWIKLFHALGPTDRAVAISVNSATGKVAFTGEFTDTFDVNGTILNSVPKTTFIVELNSSNGSNSLVKKTGGKYAEDFQYDPNGNFLMTGTFIGTTSFDAVPLTAMGNSDIFFSSWTSSGNLNFVKQIGGTGLNSQNMFPGAIGMDGNNNIFVGGHMCETTIFDSDTLNALGAADAFLAKYDGSGVLQWAEVFRGDGDWESIEDMQVMPGGIIFMNGRFDDHYVCISNDTIHSVCNCSTNHIFTALIAGDANKISGHLFIDFNSNNVKDGADFFLPNEKVISTPVPGLIFTDSTGFYETFVDTGNFQVVSAYNHPYYTPSPPLYSITNNLYNQQYDTLDFALQPIYGITDVSMDLTDLAAPRLFTYQYFRLTYTNHGTDTINGSVELVLDTAIEYFSSLPFPAQINGDTLTWNYSGLVPFETRTIDVTCRFNVFTPAGTITQSVASITPYVTDTVKNNNSDTLILEVLAAHDPNFKEVFPADDITPAFVLNQSELEYTIHFQNTGNDTAFTVAIADTISENLDLNSLRLISASHPVLLNANSGSRRMEFIFNNILLPDSTTDEPNSHGFVKYAIKPLNTLVAGDSILNTSYIYFDFNLPVVTNTTITKVVMPSSVQHLVRNDKNVIVFPNPSENDFFVQLKTVQWNEIKLELYSLYGDKIKTIIPGISLYDRTVIHFNLSEIAGGIYLLKISGNIPERTVKIIKM